MNAVRIILLGMCIFTAHLLLAQNSGTYWYRGTVYLVNGENAEGMILPNPEENYLLIRPNNTNITKAYYARQVYFYEIIDPVTRAYRTYYSLPHPTKIQKTHLFYELLQEGELSLLSRESVRVQEDFARQMQGTAMVYRPYLYTIVIDEFYVLDKKGKVKRFYESKKELLKLMPEQAGKIEEFIETRKLRTDDKAHLKAIFRYYHTLQISKVRMGKALQEPAYYIPVE